jgi:hypothetical protein
MGLQLEKRLGEPNLRAILEARRQSTQSIAELKATEGFTRIVENIRGADFRSATGLRGPVEILDLAHPAGQ